MLELSPNFNNREISSALWITVVVAISLIRAKDVRSSLGLLFKAFMHWKIILITGLFSLNIYSICRIMSAWNIWKIDQFSATIIWAALQFFPLISATLNAQEQDEHFEKLFWYSLKLSVVFEFVAVANPFSLTIELFLVPLTTFLAILLVVAERDEKAVLVYKIISWVLIVTGIVIAWHSVQIIWEDPAKFFTGKTARNFVLPALLTIGSIPFLYLLYCYSHIEYARIDIDQKTFQSNELKRYARRRFFLIFPLRPWLLRRAVRRFQSMPAESRTDVNRIVEEIYKYEREVDNPPTIDPEKGWSPYLALKFLIDYGLRSVGNRSNFDEQWWAGSSTVDLDKAIVPNTVTYYLEGENGVANSLKLKGFFLDEFLMDEGIEEFANIATALAEIAISEEITDDILDHLFTEVRSLRQGTQIILYTNLSWQVERFASDKGFHIIFHITR